MNENEKLMRYCLELALKGSGFVSPNPLVGAVIVNNNGAIIAEGWHKKYGDLHAEINAINNAKENGINDFSDTTLYVNLEPCSHFGKQPPCVDAIIEAKIPTVIVGMKDPNPLVAGKGIEKLIAAGINVEVGVLENDCHWINRFFCHYITEGMPYVVLKIAQTVDGCIATKDGESKWITCDESRRRTHFLRSEMDAIMVGVDTILTDDPILDTRLLYDKNCNSNENEESRKRNPKIIILDSHLRTPANSKVLASHKEREVFIVYSDELEDNPEIDLKKRKDDLENAGAILWEAPVKNGKIHLRKAISRLTFEYCFTSLLVEGGSKLFSSFINSNLVNEMQFFVSPMIMGDGLRAFSNVETANLEAIKKFRLAGSFQSGTDEHLIMVQ
jgi:diaminohydroxyphosphoribosylaminopyrimidine deaminase/5-amino-6-(5-phosphoribosylamino)uracil reductase